MTTRQADVDARLANANLPSYTCPLCVRTSHNLFDARHHYCSCCGSDDLPKACEHRKEPTT